MQVRQVVLCLLVSLVSSQITLQFSKNDLVPEGVDYARQHGFLVGSIGLGQIHTVNPQDGSLQQLTSTNRLSSTVGIQVDEERNRICATNNAVPFPQVSQQASVVELRLDNGAFVAEYDFTSLLSGNKFLNDVAVDAKRSVVYVTDSVQGAIYSANTRTGRVELFVQSDLLAPLDVNFGIGLGANGIEIWNSEYIIVTRTVNNTNTNGVDLYKINLSDSNRTLRRVDLSFNFPLGGTFDGLYFNRQNGHLFAVGGGSSFVYEISSNNDWASASVIQTFPMTSPTITTCVVVDDSIFALANSFFSLTGPDFIEQGDDQDVNFNAASPPLFEDSSSSRSSSRSSSSSSSSEASSLVVPLLFCLASLLLL